MVHGMHPTRRNRQRFPDDFLFQLTGDEKSEVVANCDHPKLAELEKKVGSHDSAIAELIEAIRRLMAPPAEGKKRPIGFAPWEEK